MSKANHSKVPLAIISTLTLLTVIFTGTISSARTFYLKDIDVSLYVPSNYDQIPKYKWDDLVVEGAQSVLSKEYFKANYEKFDYLFHKNTNKSLLEGPYIFVIEKRARSFSRYEFKNYVDTRILPLEDIYKNMQETGSASKDFNMKFIGEPFVDYKNKYFYYKMENSIVSLGYKNINYQYYGFFPKGSLVIYFSTYNGISESPPIEQDEEFFMEIFESIYD